MNKNLENTHQSLLLSLNDTHNEMAWEVFYQYYNDFIFSLVRSQGVATGDIEDLVQVISFKCWQSLSRGQYDKNSGKFRNWLGGVCRHAVNDHFRKCYSEKRKTDSLAAEAPLSPKEETEWIEKEWQDHLLKLAWQEAKLHFSEKILNIYQRIVLGEDVNKIADSEDLKVNTIYVYRNRVEDGLASYIRQMGHYL